VLVGTQRYIPYGCADGANSYLEGVRFEYRSVHQLFSLRFSLFSSDNPVKYPDIISIIPRPLPFEYFPSHTRRIRRYTMKAIEGAVR
jgi:hypothetical protein